MSGEAFVPVQAFPALTPPNSANVDVYLMADGTVRQIMVIGDPNIQANVAPVDPTFGLAVDIKRSTSFTVLGGSADNSANLSTKLPVIPARANASAPSWSEGFQVPLSVDLSGALRVSGASGGGVAQLQTRNSLNAWVDVGYFAGDLSAPVQVQNGLTILSIPSVTVLQGTNPWITSGVAGSGGVTPVLAATANGLTINGTLTVNQGTPLSPILANAWPVNVISQSNIGLTITSMPAVTISGTINANVTSSVPNLTLTSIPAVTQGTTPWVVTNLVGNTITALQGTPLSPTLANAWPVNVVSSTPNLTLTSLPSVTVLQGTSPWLVDDTSVTPVLAATANGLTINGSVTSNQGTSPWVVTNLVGNTITSLQGTPLSPTIANAWPVNVVSSVPNLTLTSLPNVTVLQGTSPWVTSGGSSGGVTPVLAATANGLTINGTITANQGVPLAPTPANAWPVNVVSTVPNLTLTSLPVVTVSGNVNANVTASVPNLTLTSIPPVTQGTSPWIVNVVSTVPNLTLTSLPTLSVSVTSSVPNLTLTSIPAVNQGTSPWVVTNLNGNTVTALQGTPAAPTIANAWPVNVVSSVPNLTLTSLPSVTVLQGTSPWLVDDVSVTPVLAATANGLTINGSVTSNQGTPLSPTLPNAWPVNVVSSVPNLTITSMPALQTTPGTTISVLQSTPGSVNSPWPVTNLLGNTITALGNTSDNAANPTNKIPVLPARANASPQTWSEGNVVPLSVDLAGALRVSGASGGGVAQLQVRNSANTWIDVGYQPDPTNMSVPVRVQNGLTFLSNANLTIGAIGPLSQGNPAGPGLTFSWLVTVNGNTLTSLQGAPLPPTVANAWPVNVVSSVPNLTLTSLPSVTVLQGTNPWITAGGGTTQVIAATANGLTINGFVTATQGTSPWVVTNLAGNTITSLQGTPLPPTLGNAWPVNVVSSVPNLTITSMPAITVTPGITITTLASVTLNPPVYVTGTSQPSSLDTAGNLRVNVLATVPNLTLTSIPAITGTVTANQGTATAPTLVNAWPVNVVSSVPNLTLTSLPTVTINTPTVNQGTPNTFANAWPVVNLNGNTISALQSGTWTVQPGNTPNTVPWLVTTVNGSTVTVVQPVAANLQTTANQGGVWTVTSNQGTPLSPTLPNAWPVNVVSSVPNLTITSMPAIQVTPGITITTLASVTLNPPVYVTGTSQPLSLDTAGNLRVNVLATVPNLTLTSIPNIVGTVTANQGTATAPTVANAWPVNVVSSVPNLTLTSLPNVTVLQGTSPWIVDDISVTPVLAATANGLTINGTVAATQGTSPWVVSNLVGNTITVLQTTAANLQATANQGTPLSPTVANAWPVNVVSSVPNLTITSMPAIQTTPGTTITVLASVTTNPPVYVTGTSQPLSLDTTGNLRVNVLATVPNLTLTSLPAITGTVTANQGTATAPTLANAWPVNVVSSVPNLTLTSIPAITGTVNQGTPNTFANAWPVVNLNGNTISALQSGTWTVQPGNTPNTVPWLVTTVNGSTVTVVQPVAANLQTTANQGTPLAPTVANAWPVNVVSSVPNLTITSMPAIQTTPGTTVTVLGAVTLNPPAYNTGTGQPLSLDTTGNLRVSVLATVPNLTLTSIPNIAGTVTANQGTPNTFANAWPVVNLNGNTISALQSGTWTVQPGNTPNTTPWLVTTVNGSTVTVVQPVAANLNATVSGTVTANQGTAGSLGSPWPVTNLQGNTITVLSATAANLQATANQGTPLSATIGNAWPVNVVSSVPNLTITSMPALQTTPGVTITALQGTPLAATLANAWPVNVVSSVPNLTISSMPNIAVTPGTTITVLASVTLNPPVDVTGTAQPLSLDTAGNLRVSVLATVPNLTLTSIPNIAGTVTANQGTAGPITSPWPVVNLNGNTISALQSGTWTVQPGNTPNTVPWLVTTVNGSTVTVVQPVAANLNATVTGTITANQGTAGTFGSPWPVTNLQGNTITVLQSVAANLQTTANQGTPLSPTVANSWPVNVVSSVPNLTITSMPAISTVPGTTISVAKANASAPSNIEGTFVPLSVDLSGALRVSGSAGGGVAQTQVRDSANAWVDVGYQPSPTNLYMPVQVQNGLTILSMPAIQATVVVQPSTTQNGTSIFRTASLTETPQSVNASPGRLYGWHVRNPNSVDIYLQVYDLPSGSVSVGVTTPTETIWIPAYGAIDDQPTDMAKTYTSAISIAATTLIDGSTMASTGLLVNIYFA